MHSQIQKYSIQFFLGMFLNKAEFVASIHALEIKSNFFISKVVFYFFKDST